MTKKSDGSALIIVLWALVLIGFLAGQYLDHNRQKASLAVNAWDKLRQTESVESVLNLFSTDSWPIASQMGKIGEWNRFSPDGIELWVKVDDESGRININSAPEGHIRDKILGLMGEELVNEADHLADAILDWRDEDELVRMHGAEVGFYQTSGLDYAPANGPFKVLTEMLLVRGVTTDLFWGDPIIGVLAGGEAVSRSLLEDFTIYTKEVKRVSILAPGRQSGYTYTVALLEKKGDRWDVLDLYQTMLVSSIHETASDQGEGLH
jgi:type II secretory pathway component PulK